MKTTGKTFKDTLQKEFSMTKMSPELSQQFNQLTSNLKEVEEDGETAEATSSGSVGGYSAPLFGGEMKEDIEKIETKEATTSGSVGAYSTPAMWAKSTKKKDWGPSRKTQIPGGSFVSVKEKCTKFPYCNQGDIKALNLYKNKKVKSAIKNVAEKLNINESMIMAILEYELEKLAKTN